MATSPQARGGGKAGGVDVPMPAPPAQPPPGASAERAPSSEAVDTPRPTVPDMVAGLVFGVTQQPVRPWRAVEEESKEHRGSSGSAEQPPSFTLGVATVARPGLRAGAQTNRRAKEAARRPNKERKALAGQATHRGPTAAGAKTGEHAPEEAKAEGSTAASTGPATDEQGGGEESSADEVKPPSPPQPSGAPAAARGLLDQYKAAVQSSKAATAAAKAAADAVDHATKLAAVAKAEREATKDGEAEVEARIREGTNGRTSGAARAPGQAATRRERARGGKGKAAADPATEQATGAEAATPPTPADAERVWTQVQQTLLQKRIRALPTPTQAEDEVKYAEHYKAARRTDYRVRADGLQRAPTDTKVETLFLWRAKFIYLAYPPKFIDETHTLQERLALWQIHYDHMMYKVYIATPARFKATAATVKYRFCQALVEQNQQDGGASSEVLELLNDVHLFTCSADSQLAVLRFVRPDTRDKWTDRKFAFLFGHVWLRATDTFEQDYRRLGLDAAAVDKLYPIHLLGKPNMPMTDIMAVAKLLSGGLPILNISPQEPTGARALDDHVWKITLNTIEAPAGVAKIRELRITQGTQIFEMGVHQPRHATRHPCRVCLSTGHYRGKCPVKLDAKKALELRTPYAHKVKIPLTAKYAAEPAPTDLEEHRAQMERMRAKLAPELAKATATAAAEAAKQKREAALAAQVRKKQADAAAALAAKAEHHRAQKAGSEKTATRSAQVKTITKALATAIPKKRTTERPATPPVDKTKEAARGAKVGTKHQREDNPDQASPFGADTTLAAHRDGAGRGKARRREQPLITAALEATAPQQGWGGNQSAARSRSARAPSR